jgi:hypothetical protein
MFSSRLSMMEMLENKPGFGGNAKVRSINSLPPTAWACAAPHAVARSEESAMCKSYGGYANTNPVGDQVGMVNWWNWCRALT